MHGDKIDIHSSLIRKITDELASTFMIDHAAAAILVDIADSFATVVRTTLAISESRSYIRLSMLWSLLTCVLARQGFQLMVWLR